MACWSPWTNTILTCYEELSISLWDVYRINGLPRVQEIYDDFFPTNKLTLDKKLARSFQALFRIWSHLHMGTHRPKFTEWVKEFIPECLDNMQLNNLSP